MSKALLLKPRLSEKAYALSEQANTYVFDIPSGANRHIVADAVYSQYEVEVQSVKIARSASKPLKSYRKGGRNIASSRSGVKKAYVTLKEGSKLPFFATEDKAKDGKK